VFLACFWLTAFLRDYTWLAVTLASADYERSEQRRMTDYYATLFRSRGYRMDSLLLYGSVCSTASETLRLPYDGKYLAPTLSIPSLCATVISGVIGHNGYGGDCRLILESSCAHPLASQWAHTTEIFRGQLGPLSEGTIWEGGGSFSWPWFWDTVFIRKFRSSLEKIV